MSRTESVIFRSHPSWLSFMGLILLTITMIIFFIFGEQSIGCAGLVLILLLILVFVRYRRLYTITNYSVIMRIGLVANNTNEMEIRHIRGINIRQSVVERLLGIGTLEISSAAADSAEVVFSGIQDPIAVKEMIRALRPTH